MSLPRDLSFTFPHPPTTPTNRSAPSASHRPPLHTPSTTKTTTTTTTTTKSDQDITALPSPALAWDPQFSTLLAHPRADLALRHPNPKPVPRVPGTGSSTHIRVDGGEKTVGQGRVKTRRASSLDFEPWCPPGRGVGLVYGRWGGEGSAGMEGEGEGNRYAEFEDWELEDVAEKLRGELRGVEGELETRRKMKRKGKGEGKGMGKGKEGKGKGKEGKGKVKRKLEEEEEETRGRKGREDGWGTVFARMRGWFGKSGRKEIQIGVPMDAHKNEWPEEIRKAYTGM